MRYHSRLIVHPTEGAATIPVARSWIRVSSSDTAFALDARCWNREHQVRLRSLTHALPVAMSATLNCGSMGSGIDG